MAKSFTAINDAACTNHFPVHQNPYHRNSILPDLNLVLHTIFDHEPEKVKLMSDAHQRKALMSMINYCHALNFIFFFCLCVLG